MAATSTSHRNITSLPLDILSKLPSYLSSLNDLYAVLRSCQALNIACSRATPSEIHRLIQLSIPLPILIALRAKNRLSPWASEDEEHAKRLLEATKKGSRAIFNVITEVTGFYTLEDVRKVHEVEKELSEISISGRWHICQDVDCRRVHGWNLTTELGVRFFFFYAGGDGADSKRRRRHLEKCKPPRKSEICQMIQIRDAFVAYKIYWEPYKSMTDVLRLKMCRNQTGGCFPVRERQMMMMMGVGVEGDETWKFALDDFLEAGIFDCVERVFEKWRGQHSGQTFISYMNFTSGSMAWGTESIWD